MLLHLCAYENLKVDLTGYSPLTVGCREEAQEVYLPEEYRRRQYSVTAALQQR